MDKIIIILVLAALAAVLVAAINKKSIVGFGKDLIAFFGKGKTKTPPPPSRTPAEEEMTVQDPASPFGTRFITDLEIHQLNEDGTVFYLHRVSKREMRDASGVMVGLAISHPGSTCPGLILHGKKVDGNFDMTDPATKAAMTVNSQAVQLGFDEKGFYGVVTNEDARVYVLEDGKTEKLQYDDCFHIGDIGSEKCVLIGDLWLRFVVPEPPRFPGAKVAHAHPRAEEGATPSDQEGPKEMRRRVREKTVEATSPEKLDDSSSEEESKYTPRFHIYK